MEYTRISLRGFAPDPNTGRDGCPRPSQPAAPASHAMRGAHSHPNSLAAVHPQDVRPGATPSTAALAPWSTTQKSPRRQLPKPDKPAPESTSAHAGQQAPRPPPPASFDTAPASPEALSPVPPDALDRTAASPASPCRLIPPKHHTTVVLAMAPRAPSSQGPERARVSPSGADRMQTRPPLFPE